MKRRLATLGLTLVTALGMGACQTAEDAEPAPAGSATGAHDAAAAKELVAAAAKLVEDTVRVDTVMSGGLTMAGSMDPRAGKARMTMTMAAAGKGSDIRMVKLCDDMYMKFNGGLADVVGGKWIHVDVAELKAGSTFAIMPKDDPTGAESLARAVTQVGKQGADTYTGVLDITKAPNLNKDSLKALGATSNTVPFAAKVDGQGRLTEMTVDMSALAHGAGTMKTTYSGFGTAVKVAAPPASQVTEPPKELADLLNA